jgi:nucleotide-binding universal stress UspA family protein
VVSQHDFVGTRDTDIVVGVDGSPSAKAAVRWALVQARRSGGRVCAVTAWEIPAYVGWMPMLPHEDLGAAAGKVLAESVAEVLAAEEPGVELAETVLPGHPAQVLVDESAHAALLVVGSRGRGTFAGTLLGSVSQHCVQHAHCPVVVVRGKS